MTWVAQYEQGGKWYDMGLQHAEIYVKPGGTIRALGNEQIGSYKFYGQFSKDDLTFKFVKQYFHQYDVYYEGKFSKKKQEFIGHWGFFKGGNIGKFRMYKKE